jgi:predicted site-specific integrase-resolvase
MPNVYSRNEAARTLKISVETLDRYRLAGKLPYRQIGDRVVFTDSDLIRFLDSCGVSETIEPTAREQAAMKKAAEVNA